MSGITFDKMKQIQGYRMPMQRDAAAADAANNCGNCNKRIAHQMQCGRSGIYVQQLAVCNRHEAKSKPEQESV